MKKILLPLVIAMSFMAITACSDDNDLPKVNISFNVSNAEDIDGTLYIEKGDTLRVNSITVEDLNGKGAIIGTVTYYWDYAPLSTVALPPFSIAIPTKNQPVGTHILQAEMSVLAVDKTPSKAWVERDVVIVIPGDLPSENDN